MGLEYILGGFPDLVISALEYADKYQTMLNELEELDYIDPGSEDPTSPSYAPRKPSPISGAGAVALPLPEKDRDTDA